MGGTVPPNGEMHVPRSFHGLCLDATVVMTVVSWYVIYFPVELSVQGPLDSCTIFHWFNANFCLRSCHNNQYWQYFYQVFLYSWLFLYSQRRSRHSLQLFSFWISIRSSLKLPSQKSQQWLACTLKLSHPLYITQFQSCFHNFRYLIHSTLSSYQYLS